MRTDPIPFPPHPEWRALELTELDVGLLTRYWCGDATAKEIAQINAWFAAKPGRRAWYEQLRAGVAETHPGMVEQGDRVRRVDAIVAAAGTHARTQRPAQHPVDRKRIPLVRMFGWMSALILVVLIGRGVSPIQSSTQKPTQKSSHYQTAPGERMVVRLADGSSVLLAPATTMVVGDAEIRLNGEAQFSVTSRNTRPFTVRTANAIVQVLGTTFVVRHYAGERTSRVAVEDGKVSLKGDDASAGTAVVLHARQVGRVTDSTVAIVADTAADRYTGWADGRLSFEGAPVRDIVTDLERAYGAAIRLDDSTLAEARVSMTVTVKTQPLSSVLNLLSQAVDAHYTRVGQAFMIVPGRRPGKVGAPSPRRQPISLQHVETSYGR